MKNKVYLIALSYIGLCSCNSDDKAHFTYDKEYSVTPSGNYINLSLDSLSSNKSRAIQYYQTDEEEYLATLNDNNSSIDFHSLKTPKKDFRIRPDLEGPQGIGPALHGFFIHNLDSIFTVYSYGGIISLIDTSANLIRKISLYESSNKFPHPYSSNRFMGVFHNQQITMRMGSRNDNTDRFFKEANNLLTVPLDSPASFREWQKFPPEVYKGNISNGPLSTSYTEISFDVNAERDLTTASFPADNYIYASKTGSEENKYYAGSQFFKPISKMKNNQLDGRIHVEHMLTNFSYSKLIYDRFRNVYYRFCLFPIKNLDLRKVRNPFLALRDFSIIILDEKLNKVGESSVLKNNQYLPEMTFISKDGLHIYCDSNTEDLMKFEQFQLSKL